MIFFEEAFALLDVVLYFNGCHDCRPGGRNQRMKVGQV
jgi:hypothetical protein